MLKNERVIVRYYFLLFTYDVKRVSSQTTAELVLAATKFWW